MQAHEQLCGELHMPQLERQLQVHLQSRIQTECHWTMWGYVKDSDGTV